MPSEIWIDVSTKVVDVLNDKSVGAYLIVVQIAIKCVKRTYLCVEGDQI